MKSVMSVFVNSIVRAQGGTAVVTASNGSTEGPPSVMFTLAPEDTQSCFIGSRFTVTVEGPL